MIHTYIQYMKIKTYLHHTYIYDIHSQIHYGHSFREHICCKLLAMEWFLIQYIVKKFNASKYLSCKMISTNKALSKKKLFVGDNQGTRMRLVFVIMLRVSRR